MMLLKKINEKNLVFISSKMKATINSEIDL